MNSSTHITFIRYSLSRLWNECCSRGLYKPLLFVLLLLPLACTNDAPPMGGRVTNRDSLPVMVTRGVSKLITDSGVIRYKIIAEEWRIFDKTKPPRWEFRQGIFVERYDNKFKVDLRFEADSAWFYNQRLWKLVGHVKLDDHTSQTRVRTELLFYDTQSGELWSNVHSTLRQPNQEIEGSWFRATMRNGRPTQYHVKQSRGFMPMGDIGDAPASPATSGANGEKADTTAQPQREGPVSRPKTKHTDNEASSPVQRKK